MKKVFGIAALLLAFAACNKIETESQVADKTEGIPFSATVSLGDNAATKALAESGSTITATWEAGEKVALIHNGVSDEMTVSSVSGGSAIITGTITSPSDGEDVTIIYPSSAADGTTGNIKADLLYTQNGLLTGEGSISKNYDVRKGTGTLKVDGTATLDGSVSLTNQFAIFKFIVLGADGTTVISAKPLTVTIGTQVYVITPATASAVLYAALPAVSGQKVSFDAVDGSNKTYTCAKASVTFDAGSYYQSTLKMREYVDMGNGLKWATMNVGATALEPYGDYFAWGETKPYYSSQDPLAWKDGKSAGYAWGSYFDTPDGGTTFTEYNNNTGGKTVLDLEDDAANANWGGSWRMPTDADWTWLRENCTWAWKTKAAGYACNGMLVTSTIDGYTDKSIFLPAAGSWNNTNFSYAGASGYYWSSSLKTDAPSRAWYVLFRDAGQVIQNFGYRRCGQSVRPVSE